MRIFYVLLLAVLLLLQENVLLAQCVSGPFTSSVLSVKPAKCFNDNSGGASVLATGGSGNFNYVWNTSPTQMGPVASNLFAGTYSVVITDAGAGCVTNGQELIVNGDFENGNTGFTTMYTYCNASLCLNTFGEAHYSIGNNANFFHPAFVGTDHTTGSGQFMIVNAAVNPNIDVWCQTVNVTPNTSYVFSGWVSSVVASSPAQLEFKINGLVVGTTVLAPSTTMTWVPFCVPWNSGGSSTAGICITDLNLAGGGNDFGLDDLSFQACSNAAALSDTLTVVIGQPSKIETDITPITLLCAGDTTHATPTTAGGTPPYNYHWMPTNGIGPTHTGLTAGTYYVMTKDSNLCTVVDTFTITEPDPIVPVLISSQDANCHGQSSGAATVSASGGNPAYTYSWSPSGLTGSSVSGLTAGNHTVTIVDSDQCVQTMVVTIAEPDPLLVEVSGLIEICDGETTPVTAQGSGGTGPYTYNWSSGGSGGSNNVPAGAQHVTVTDANGCTATEPFTVLVKSPVHAAFDAHHRNPPAPGEPVVFEDKSTNAVSWHWDFGDGMTVQDRDPSHTYAGAGNFTIVLTVTNADGCQDTAMYEFRYEVEFIEIPNVFSPNGDGMNDRFSIRYGGITDFELRIYNRWGLEVFRGDGQPGWDGTGPLGGRAADGTYYFILSGVTIQGSPVRKAGNLTLVR